MIVITKLLLLLLLLIYKIVSIFNFAPSFFLSSFVSRFTLITLVFVQQDEFAQSYQKFCN